MMRIFHSITVLAGVFWVMMVIAMISPGMTDTGPSASDVRAAMAQNGIKAGTTFQLGEKSYSIHNIAVSKTGPDSFVVSFVTK